MLRNCEMPTKKSTTDCKVSKNRSSRNAHGSAQSRSNNASEYKTKNGRARISRSEATLRNGNCNKANINSLACGKENPPVTNDPGKANAQEKMEANLLYKQTPRNIENIFYKEISDCMNEMKNTSLLIDVVQASVSHDGRRYSNDWKYRATSRRVMTHDKKNSLPKGAIICCGFSPKNMIKKRRPQTTPLPGRNNPRLEILKKSTSGSKLLGEKDFLSKIPVLARYIKAKCAKGNINKAKTSPELKFRGYNGQKANSIKIQQKNVDINAHRAEYCKRVQGKTKITLPEEKPNKLSKEGGINSNFSAFKSIGVERSSSLQPIMKKYITSKIPRTISSLTFSSVTKVGNDVDSIRKPCKNQQRIVSRIPIGVRSNIGIIKKEFTSGDKCSDSRTNDAQNSTLNDNIVPVTTVTYTEDSKGTNLPGKPVLDCGTNLSKKRFNPTQAYKNDHLDKSRALEAKRGAENICKRKIHFCSGDRNDDIVFYKRFPGKVMNKVIKSRKTSNFKHRNVLVNSKIDVKPITSSPDTTIMKPIIKEPSPAVGSEKVMKSNESGQLEEVSNKISNSTISGNHNPFSDTNLLGPNKNCSLKSFCLTKRCHELLRSEKCVQTTTSNKDIGVQVDYSIKDLQHTSKDVNNKLGYGDWKFPFSQQEVGSNSHLNAILDYCADLLKTKNDLEEVLMQCSVFENVPSIAIGCQSDGLPLMDSFSQTSCCAADKGCQCRQEYHTIRFTLTNIPASANICPLRDTFRNRSGFKTSLDGPDRKRKMACYCKEVPLDQKAAVEEERPRNLYEDEEEGDEYSEPYMTELVNTVHLEDETKICGSVPSLPEVAVANDRCESKIEIPWLKISLAPPGSYQIKNKEGHPNKVVCDCWALSTGDDVYIEGLEKQRQSGPDANVCVCKNAIAAARDHREEKKDEKKEKDKPNIAHETEVVEKPEKPEPIPPRPESKEGELEATEKNPVETETGEQKPREPEIGEEKPEAAEEKPEVAEEKPESAEEKPESAEEKPEAAEEKPEAAEENPGATEENPAEPETVEEAPETVEENPAETDTGEEKPAETEARHTGVEKLAELRGAVGEKLKDPTAYLSTFRHSKEVEATKRQAEAIKEKPEIGEGDEGRPGEEEGFSSSSGSIPSTCTCLKQEEECADIMGKPTAFVYDNPCFGQHEMYMDPIYKLFPEDCDTYCGPHIEMPWSDLTIPRNIKLRVSKKPKSDQEGCKCDRGEKGDERKREQEEEVIVCGNKDNDPSAGDKVARKPDDDVVGMEDKEIEIQLSITQNTTGTQKADNKAVGIRPTSKERGTNSNFGCRCVGSRLQQSSPIRTGPSKSRSPQCKCSRSSVRINLDSSHNRSRNQTRDPCNTRSQRRSMEKGFRQNTQDPVMNVLETCEAEMVPLRDTLNQLKSKIRNLNIPELNNWNAQSGRNNPCPPCPPMTMPMMPSQPVFNRAPSASPTSQKYQSMSQTLAQCPFPSMFPGMPSGMPPGMPGGVSSRMPPSMMSMPPRPMTSIRGCCPRCSCKEMRTRRRSGSSSTEYSDYDYDSMSEGESMCPFLRALSSKNIYKEKDPKGHRRSRTKDYPKTSERSKRKSPSSAKRYNKRSQVESCRNDNCTDTEPEIQVHYEPKRPRMKTKQVFKTSIDPNMVGPKSQRLRIAVRVTPSGEEMYNDKLLAIQGPGDSKDWASRRSQ